MDGSGVSDGCRPLGDLLRSLREGRGLTQRQLAERSRISERAIQDLERGRTRSPQFHTLNRLAEAMKLEDAERDALRRAWRPSRAGGDGSAAASAVTEEPASEVLEEPPVPEAAPSPHLEAVAFAEQTRASAARVFEIARLSPGAHPDFLLWNARGNAAVDVRLVMNARLLLRYLELSSVVEQECLVVVCRDFADDFEPAWAHRARSSGRLVVVRHTSEAFDWLAGVLDATIEPATVRGSVYCTDAVTGVAAHSRRRASSRWGVVFAVALLVVVGTVVAARSSWLDDGAQRSSVQVPPEILSPSNGARVPASFVVHGTAAPVAERELWLLVAPDFGDPSFVAATTDPVAVDPVGNWVARVTVGRGPQDDGLTYRLTPVASPVGGQIDRARKALPAGRKYVHLAAVPADCAAGPTVTVQRTG